MFIKYFIVVVLQNNINYYPYPHAAHYIKRFLYCMHHKNTKVFWDVEMIIFWLFFNWIHRKVKYLPTFSHVVTFFYIYPAHTKHYCTKIFDKLQFLSQIFFCTILNFKNEHNFLLYGLEFFKKMFLRNDFCVKFWRENVTTLNNIPYFTCELTHIICIVGCRVGGHAMCGAFSLILFYWL